MADVRLRRDAHALGRSSRCARRSARSGATSAGSLVEFPPSIGYGRLYFSTNAGRFAAISAKTGKRAWKLDLHRCVAASPAIGPHAHGTVYAVFLNQPPCNAQSGGHGHDGKVVAFSAGHGKIHWQHTIGPSESSPLLLGDRLYVGDWNGDVWAFDADNGRVLWRRHVARRRSRARSRPPAAGSTSARTTGTSTASRRRRAGRLARVGAARASTGTARFYSTPALAYGRVYIGSTDGKVYSFGAATGKLRWSHSTGGYVYASPAVWNEPRARRLVQRPLLRVRRGDGRRALARSTRTARSPARRP